MRQHLRSLLKRKPVQPNNSGSEAEQIIIGESESVSSKSLLRSTNPQVNCRTLDLPAFVGKLIEQQSLLHHASKDAKVSCWELAVSRIKDDEPSFFEDIQRFIEDPLYCSNDLPTKLCNEVERQKRIMLEKQWTLPFKVKGREVKIRGQMESILKSLQTVKDLGSAFASLDPVSFPQSIPFDSLCFQKDMELQPTRALALVTAAAPRIIGL